MSAHNVILAIDCRAWFSIPRRAAAPGTRALWAEALQFLPQPAAPGAASGSPAHTRSQSRET